VNLLLDTHAFLWFVAGDERLSTRARQAMESEDAELFLSAASIWEMAIKSSLGRLTLPVPLDEYIAEKLEHGFRVLPVDWTHSVAVEKMAFHHRDPFDRLLVAQSVAEGMALVSADPEFRQYKAKVIW
jgi:PIN domain nuclease of toxin-antitoxin system